MRHTASLLCGLVFASAATSAGAAGVNPAPPPAPQPAVAQPAAQPRPAPFGFLAEVFARRRPGVAQSDPVSILPPAAQQPVAAPLVVADPRPAAPRVVVVPLPRLRPEYVPARVAEAPPAAVTKSTPAIRQILPGIDPSTTASIDTAPATAEPAPPEPAPPPVASLPAPAAPPPDRDDMLGDPTTFFAPASTDSDPRLPSPASIGSPLPRAAAAHPAPALPVIAAGKPYELVRTLQSIQDRLAQGATEALPAQQALRSAIERTFATAGADVWQDRRNDMAAVTYVLSGGAPDVLRKFATLEPKPPIDAKLVAGVLAYAEGREKDAAELLGAIDPLDLPPSMGAQLAIAQSALVVRGDPQKAMRLLAIARLVAPGTLAEEAAIRRQIFIADQLKDDKTVQSLARQYLDRFRHSIYAGNFRARFAAALSHMDFINDEAQFPRLDDMLASVEPAARVQLYLTVALASAIKSRVVATRIAAERALALADPLSAEQARAKLYHAAALVASAKSFDAAAAEHASIDRNLLSPSDLALHDVVGATIASLRSATERPRGGPAPVAQAGSPDQETPLMKRAGAALKAVDTLLAAAR